MSPLKDEAIGRLRIMLARKLSAVTARRDAAFTWRSGTEADYEAAAELASRMSGRKMPKIDAEERRRLSERDEAIADMDETDGDALAAALVALSSPGGWQAISAAPSDGRHILVWMPRNRCSAIVSRQSPDAAWIVTFSNEKLPQEPTHWRWLPSLPTESGQ